jgi:methionine-rich copper-binding protein CopC
MSLPHHAPKAQSAAAVAAAALAGLAGCAGSGVGLDANGRPLGSDGGVNAPLTADFSSIQDHVFTPICSVCHAGASAPQGLRLDATNSYTLLVGVPSTEVPAIERVKPGDPDNSYLIQKLEGHAAVGAQMPFGGPPLSADTIATIRQWIADGAQPPVMAAAAAASTTATTAMSITAVAPAWGEVLTAPPPQIAVAFDGEIDATRLWTGTLQLERVSVVDGTESVATLRAAMTVPPGNGRALLLTPAAPLAPGHYRLVWSGEAGADGGIPITAFDVGVPP